MIKTILKEQPLHIKYRPKKFEDIVGQKDIVKSLKSCLGKKSIPHSFLFTGPAGTGKTTLARIVSSELGCTSGSTLEIDAATHSGVDDVRSLISDMKYAGFGENSRKMIIIDECHSLSKNAWQALLKSIEEPPAHIFFAFCTTEFAKVPATIKSRCHSYNLKALKSSELEDLIEKVYDLEQLEMPEKGISMIARKAEGSPRKALVYLSMASGAEDTEEISSILEQPLEDKDIINPIRKLLFESSRMKWTDIQTIIKDFKKYNPETVRITIINYTTGCLLNEKSETRCKNYLHILDLFSTPFRESDGFANLTLCLADLYYGE